MTLKTKMLTAFEFQTIEKPWEKPEEVKAYVESIGAIEYFDNLKLKRSLLFSEEHKMVFETYLLEGLNHKRGGIATSPEISYLHYAGLWKQLHVPALEDQLLKDVLLSTVEKDEQGIPALLSSSLPKGKSIFLAKSTFEEYTEWFIKNYVTA